MADFDDECLLDAEEDARTIAYIQDSLPPELKKRFSEEELYYFLDVLIEYYATSKILDTAPNKDGFIEIDVQDVATYLVKKAKAENMGDYSPDEISFIVRGEMDYVDQFSDKS